MQKITFEKLVSAFLDEAAELRGAKGAEYSGTKDVFENFKRGAKLAGLSPLQVAFIYLAKHYDSIATYVRTDANDELQSLSEPIEGRLMDAVNYLLLIHGMIQEQNLGARQATDPYFKVRQSEKPE